MFLSRKAVGQSLIMMTLILILSIVFQFYPLMFIFLFLFFFFKNGLKLVKIVIGKQNTALHLFKGIEINYFGNIKDLIGLNLGLINLWSWVFLYYSLALEKKKISLKDLDKILMGRVLSMPF
jgi:hypothetical protein